MSKYGGGLILRKENWGAEIVFVIRCDEVVIFLDPVAILTAESTALSSARFTCPRIPINVTCVLIELRVLRVSWIRWTSGFVVATSKSARRNELEPVRRRNSPNGGSWAW